VVLGLHTETPNLTLNLNPAFLKATNIKELFMNRRDSLIGAGAALFAAAQTSALAQEMVHDHSHMHGGVAQGLLTATSDCVVKGQACIAECAKTVNQTIALCSALQALTAQQSKLVPAMAKLTLEACEICEKECRKHEKHAECKACAESCVACAKECKAVGA
jgi:Cys-rich four helix bundle protein (predicted Tat secretion target)